MDRGRALLVVATALLAVFVYEGVLRPVLTPLLALPSVPGGLAVMTAVLTVFSLTHAAYALGWRHALVFFAITAVVSWAFEQIGVETGAVYGRYHYTDVLGAKLGHVPILIPMAWFMMIYPSYVITNLIADGRAVGTRGGVARVVLLAGLGALVMTAWDLVVDPILSGSDVRAWIWEDGGPYFDIPAQNFAGWIATTFAVYLVYRLLEGRWRAAPAGASTPPVAAMALVAYGAMLVANLGVSAVPDALVVIGPMVMGIPLAAATLRLLSPRMRSAD